MSWQVTGSFTWNETVWNPSMISTALWLDAADSSTLFTTDTGSTLVVSGDTVGRWNDKSGNNKNVIQATESNRPLFTADLLNGLPLLTFDGSTDQLVNTAVGLPTGAAARSLFAVYRPLRSSVSNTVFSQGIENTTGRWFALQFRSGPVGDPYFAGFSSDVSSGDAIEFTDKLAVVTYDGTTVTVFKNGTSKASASRTLNTTGNNLRIGTSPDQAEHANCRLAEIVMIASSASTDTRQRIEGYLAHKWGLTANLPNDHPYKTVGPTP
jgi:hypothetical protein